MALERIPADIKKDGGIARASDPSMIREIMEATSIPVMAKARIGHFAEAQVGRLVGGGLQCSNLKMSIRSGQISC